MKSTWLQLDSLLLLLLLLLMELSFVSPQEGNKPNFVLMMVDDLGIGDLGCYGNKTLRTPNIDQLAQEGAKLTHHIAAASLCTPSRAAFLTGRYPIRSGLADHREPGVFIFNAASGGLPSQEVTFAKLAKQQGYETALIGKWHLGLNCKSSDDHCHHPSTHGFKYFFGIPLTNLRDCQPGHGTVFQIQKYFPFGTLGIVLVTAVFLHHGGIITIRRGLILSLLSLLVVVTVLAAGLFLMIPYFNCVLLRDHSIVEQPFTSENLTQRMTHEAVDFIERNSARPFLLFFSFVQVHTAVFASAAFRGTSRHGIYGDAVHEVDWSVGQIMEALERLNLRENTLVYLTSDQGAHLEEISASGEVMRGWNGIYKGSSVWKAFYFTPNFYPEDQTACFHTQVCFCSAKYVTYHDPPLLFDLTRDPSETTPLTPDTEPAFHSILAAMEEAVEIHQRSVKPVESQLTAGKLIWRPWLQPCCSTLTQLCQCQQDQ
uniref:Sulfatase N-terminal domain-containing protein n=1 Tax=Amphiprion ocellaris TaxID=80972 RepID=A0A3Q1BYQ0_AMPOC